MKRILFLSMLLVVGMSSLTIGCRDETDPEYNIKLLYDRPWREKALKNITEIFNKTMQENDNDLDAPEAKKLVDILVPGLSKAYMDFDKDQANRIVIMELLAQMKDERSVDVYLNGLELDKTSDAKMFNVAASAVRRQKVERALPALLEGWKKCQTARQARQGGPFTNSENEIVQSFISAASSILAEHNKSSHKKAVVDAFVTIVDTPDTLQELRLNMRAMQGLGRIGDAAGVPVLVRGIAMKGKKQPIPLGEIAFTALQQIHDRDAVVKGMLAFAKGEDKAFNDMFKEELETDPVMKNPLWFIQQTVTFFGTLNYKSPEVLSFLESEFNHMDPDKLDEKTAEMDLPIELDASGWAEMRRNWGAVALGELNQTDIMDALVDRIVFERNKMKTPKEEAVGYFRAMALLAVPDKACPVYMKALKSADDSLRDKLFYSAALMCKEPFLKPMDQAIKKIDCDKIVKERFDGQASEEEEKQTRNECEVMIKRIEGYKDRITFGKECGDNLDCYLKEIDNHTSKNIERAIISAFRIARKDKGARDKVVATLMKNLHNPSKVAMTNTIRVLDHLTPQGSEELEKRITEVYANFARQSAYKDRARMLEAFIGHVRNRGR